MHFAGPSDIMPIMNWLSLYKGRLIVAGPCSVESHHQLLATAQGLSQTGRVTVLRAGLWKPRSRPGKFEGVGARAFPWLKEIKEKTGMQIAVEAAMPEHATLCLEHGVDMIWLGARTTVNPFMVQEIADAIKGSGIPVMIKNPVSPDVRLWVGAIERVHLAGSNKIIAIHRGFHNHEQSIYRNIPLWEIPMQLKRELPGLPVICDPSHIAGNRKWVKEVAQIAFSRELDGLMIETHHKPEEALTDAHQQITPAELTQILDDLFDESETPAQAATLKSLRNRIDEQDYQILELLAKRMRLVKEVGTLKKALGEDVVQPGRQQKLLDDREQKGSMLNLNKPFIRKIMQLVHEESVNIQSTLAHSESRAEHKEQNKPTQKHS